VRTRPHHQLRTHGSPVVGARPGLLLSGCHRSVPLLATACSVALRTILPSGPCAIANAGCAGGGASFILVSLSVHGVLQAERLARTVAAEPSTLRRRLCSRRGRRCSGAQAPVRRAGRRGSHPRRHPGHGLQPGRRSAGITAPNGLAQQDVYRKALEDARVAPDEVMYVEAHGTGTLLATGRVRLAAIGLRPRPRQDRRLSLGAPRPISGTWRARQAGRHDQSDPGAAARAAPAAPEPHGLQLHAAGERVGDRRPDVQRRLAARQQAADGRRERVRLQRHQRARDPGGGARRGARAPSLLGRAALHVLALSRASQRLQELAGRYAQRLERSASGELADICHTSLIGRTHLEHRACVIAASAADAKAGLIALARGERHQSLVEGKPEEGNRMHSFPGGRRSVRRDGAATLRTEPTFQTAMDQCAAILAKLLKRRCST